MNTHEGDELLHRLRRFHSDYFPGHQQRFQDLVAQGQHPKTLFIGCSDSRLVPYLLTGAGPGELFVVRNVGAFIPPYDGSHGLHGTMAAIEFAVLSLEVERIVGAATVIAAPSAPPMKARPRKRRRSRPGSSSPAKRCFRSGPAPRHCGAPSSAAWCCNWSG